MFSGRLAFELALFAPPYADRRIRFCFVVVFLTRGGAV